MRMPPRRQPPTLKDAALQVLIHAVTYQVRVLMSTSALRHEHTLRSVSETVATLGSLGTDLAGRVVVAALRCADPFLSYRNNHPGRRVLERLLCALLPEASTRSLALPVAESYPLREALLRRAARLHALRELVLSESLHVHTSVDLAVAALPSLRRLTAVRAPWLCSDAMALALAKHCPALELLDASESERVTDRGVDALAAACTKLRVLLLTGCHVSTRGYERLLSSRPGLRCIGRCPSLGSVVRAAAAARSKMADDALCLSEWSSDALPDDEEASLCPALTAVSLSDVVLVLADEADGLADGARLPDAVRVLRVDKVGLRDHPRPMRLQLGAALTALDVMEPLTTLGDVVALGRQCPSLRSLRLAASKQTFAVPGQRVQQHPAREAPFRELQELHLYSGPGPVLEYVLLHATAIRTVRVVAGPADGGDPLDEEPAWTDAVMRRVTTANPLTDLRAFSLACPCALTMDSVYALVLGCPALRVLHDLAEWKVSCRQVEELRELVAVNNWDLDLGPA